MISAALGVFFYLREQDEEWAVENLGWLPLVSLVAFITVYSLGYGPIPWVMMGKINIIFLNKHIFHLKITK